MIYDRYGDNTRAVAEIELGLRHRCRKVFAALQEYHSADLTLFLPTFTLLT